MKSVKIAKKILAYIVLILCITNTCIRCDDAYAESQTQQKSKRVLYLSSYSYSWTTVPDQIEGIQEVLDNNYIINYEFMDTKNNYYSDNYKEFYEFLSYKLEKRELYDAVIAADDAALNFVMLYKNVLFQDIPIVFLGIDNIEVAKEAAKDPYITGVAEQADYKTSLELAKKIYPKAQNLVFILDNAENGIGIQKQLDADKELFDEYNVTYINSSNYTKKLLCKKISELTENDIVFCLSMSGNKGDYIYTEEDRYQILNTNAHVPMFLVTSSGVGMGTLLGGYVVDHRECGKIAGNMVKEALENNNISNIEIDLNTPCKYYFDQNVIDKFKIDKRVLPSGSTIINEKPGFVQQNYKIIINAAVISIISLLLIVLLFQVRYNIRYTNLNKILEKKNDELEDAGKYKSDFLSNMSHEIRTPMNAIIGMTKLAQSSNSNAEMRGYIDEIDASSQYLLSIINDVLDMSRIDSGRFELNMGWCYMSEAFLTCVNMIEPQMKEKGIEFNYPDFNTFSDVLIYTDPIRIEQVCMNLLNNAYKFTPRGGTITFDIKNEHFANGEGADSITISDTGYGMSEEFLEKAFQPFEREVNERTINIQGTGLGLSLVKKIVDSMGGDIKVESKLGVGTTFTIRMPYRYRIEKRNKNTVVKEAPQNLLVGKRILLVEDNQLNRKIARTLLEKKKIVVEEADNGLKAIDMLKASGPEYYDLIIMDIRMPKMNGIEATKKIRKIDREDLKNIPIIAMTANAFEEDINETRKAGMNEHLAKPIEPQKLYNIIAKYVNN